MEMKETILLNHYTYGLHPHELGFGIKVYSDERIKEYEGILERIVSSVDFSDVNKEGEVNILYVLKDKVIISLITPNGIDQLKRKGIFSHNIVIGRLEYIQLGARPSIFEKYFTRDINLRGIVDKIEISPSLEKEIPRIEVPTNALKNILSLLIRGKGVVVICKNGTLTTKLPYFLLEFLPTSKKLIPYITSFPKKNLSSYKLIITREDQYVYEEGWGIFDINKTKDFLPKDHIDEAINLMVEYCKKKGDLRECHELWHKIEQKYPDIESSARIFLYETKITEEGIIHFLKETIEKQSYDTKERCNFLLNRIEEIPTSERLKIFLSLSKLKLSISNDKEELREIMTKVASIFPKEEQLEIINALGKEFPDYKNIIYSGVRDLEKDFGKEFSKYIEKYPDMVNGLDECKRIEYVDNMPLDKKLELYYNYIRQMNMDKIIEMMDKRYESSPMYKSLITSYEYIKSKSPNKENDEKAKFIVKKLADAIDRTIKKNFTGLTLEKISIQAVMQFFSSGAIFSLLYCLKHFNLKEDIRKLEKITRDYISIIFSLDKKQMQDLEVR